MEAVSIVHLIRSSRDSYPLEVARRQAAEGHNVSLILLHDGVYLCLNTGLKTYACRDDVLARGIQTQAELVDYDRILELVFAHDNVCCW